MRGGGGGQQQAGDQISSFFWVICIIDGVIVLTWWLKREWIVTPIFQFRIYESYLLEYVSLGWVEFAKLVPWLHLPVPNVKELENIRDYMTTTPIEYVR